MIRIAGVIIPDNKRIDASLPYVYGIGRSLAVKILEEAKIDPSKRTNKLTQEEVGRLKDIVEKKYRVEGDLKREIMMNIKRLKDVGSYRGARHMRGLPARGQRTKTNSRTRRGNKRVTVGSGRKAVEKK